MLVGLLLFAAVLFALEAILPGGILGIFAVLIIIGASIYGFAAHSFLVGGTILLGGLAFAALFFYFELRLLSGKLGNRLLSHNQTSSSHTGMTLEASLAGSEARALTRMNPTGKIVANGRTYPAWSTDGMIAEGETVVITSAEPFKIEVARKTTRR